MREFEYHTKAKEIMDFEIVEMLSKLHEFKGGQNVFVKMKTDTLDALLTIAKIQSTEASNKIEGIHTSNDRIKQLALDKTLPKTRGEEEIAGYRDVLRTIHESHDYIPFKPAYILQLHRDLYKFSGKNFGGKFKTINNVITEETSSGERRVRFEPLESWETPGAIEELCKQYTLSLIHI